ncbi:hypothetical protein KSS87_020619 [Heliosperma pusillum]|nr:hypothetical protein KSS87_020619 [Heliosperma pusillum]
MRVLTIGNDARKKLRSRNIRENSLHPTRITFTFIRQTILFRHLAFTLPTSYSLA